MGQEEQVRLIAWFLMEVVDPFLHLVALDRRHSLTWLNWPCYRACSWISEFDMRHRPEKWRSRSQ